MTCWAVIAAAGSGTRMGGDVPKILLPLNGQPALAWSLKTLVESPSVEGICVSVSPELEKPVRELLEATDKPFFLAEGGADRSASVLNGLRALPSSAEYVLVHDGARPCLKREDLEKLTEVLSEHGSAVAGYRCRNTVHFVDTDGRVTGTPERSELFEAQTPQGFRTAELIDACEKATAAGLRFTDEASMMFWAGYTVQTVETCADNIKLTVPADISIAEAVLGGKKESMLRIGYGYDVHALAEGRRLILGGVDIPWEKGLDGHSDADVLTHAVMDALLGAAAMGDIGMMFPPADDRWKDADSLELLRKVCARLSEAGFRVVNVDATLIAQRPKLLPYRGEMTAKLSAVLGIPEERVSVKATTTEHLGFEGREEGISASAVALLEKQYGK